MNVQTDFPQLLRDFRKKNGLTQKSLAARLGLSYNTIVGYEHGKNLPAPMVRAKIAELIGCELLLIPQGKSGAKVGFTPLTDEEQNFADQNHYLVIDYLKYNRLEFEE